MSETRHFKGKLVKIGKRYQQTVEEQAKELLSVDAREDLVELGETYVEQLLYKGDYQDYFVINDTIYKTKELNEIDVDDDIFEARKMNGNDYEFDVRYYDGGCSLQEAVETAIKRMENNKSLREAL